MSAGKIVFECSIVTPMFLCGADGNTPEMRPPSIKGAMRFWWRALHPHLGSIRTLRQEEAKIFGSSDQDIGRSKFSIVVTSPPAHDDEEDKARPLPHSDTKKFKRLAFIPDRQKGNFTVEITFRKKVSSDEMCDKVKNLFIVTSILGGLGKRCRRGFGSFQIVSKNGYGKFETPSEIIDKVFECIQNIVGRENNKYRIMSNNGVKIIKVANNYTNMNYPYIKEIVVGSNLTEDYRDLLEKIGEASHKYNYASLGYAGKAGRLASPVFVSVIRVKDGFLPVVTTLNTILEKKLEGNLWKELEENLEKKNGLKSWSEQEKREKLKRKIKTDQMLFKRAIL